MDCDIQASTTLIQQYSVFHKMQQPRGALQGLIIGLLFCSADHETSQFMAQYTTRAFPGSHGHFFPEPTMVEPGRSSRCAVVKPLRLQRWDALMLNLFTERIPTSTNNAPPVPILCCILSPFFLG